MNKGTQFEKLIERLEKLLGSFDDVNISHNVWIKDKITGQKRQIDIWMTAIVGSIPVKVMFECRNRDKLEDVTWVEQVKVKRDDVKADKAVMITSSSFTKPAKDKAKHNGIIIRTVDELSIAEIAEWIIEKVELRVRSFKIVDARLNYKSQFSLQSPSELDKRLADIQNKASDTISLIRENLTSDNLLYIEHDETTSVKKILTSYIKSDKASEKLKLNNPTIHSVTINFNEKLVAYDFRELEIENLEATLEVDETLIVLRPSTVKRYAERGNDLVQFIEVKGEFDGQKFTLNLFRMFNAHIGNKKVEFKGFELFDKNRDGNFAVMVTAHRGDDRSSDSETDDKNF